MLALMYERIGWPLEKVLRVVDVVKPLPQPAQLLIQVHDSLIVECPEELVPEVVRVLRKVMTQPWKELGGFTIPIGVKVGNSWGEAETYDA
jgi:DNA polymerase I-like protein with 3'-5' exonuclease and polymerase domains